MMAEGYEWEQEAEAIEAEAAATAAREKRAIAREARRREVKQWFDDKPLARIKLQNQILRHLLSAVGRNGPGLAEIAEVTEYGWEHVELCINALKKSGGIKEDKDEDDFSHFYHYKVWRTLHPERRGKV